MLNNARPHSSTDRASASGAEDTGSIPVEGTKVLVFGVFDLLHPGHKSFLKQAEDLGDRLIVSVARDENAQEIKGHLPVWDENKRLEKIKGLDMVDEAVLGAKDDPWPHIIKIAPDIIALGYDQAEYVDDLEKGLKKHGLKTCVARLNPFQPEKYKSSKIRNKQNSGEQV